MLLYDRHTVNFDQHHFLFDAAFRNTLTHSHTHSLTNHTAPCNNPHISAPPTSQITPSHITDYPQNFHPFLSRLVFNKILTSLFQIQSSQKRCNTEYVLYIPQVAVKVDNSEHTLIPGCSMWSGRTTSARTKASNNSDSTVLKPGFL